MHRPMLPPLVVRFSTALLLGSASGQGSSDASSPRREEIEYFVHCMEEEIARNKSVLSRAAMNEYREALRTFRDIYDLVGRDK